MSYNDLPNILFAVLTALVSALIFTPIIRKAAPLIGAVDVPKDDRRMHSKPMPLCGGVAIFIGFSIAAFIFCEKTPAFWGIWLGAFLITAIGVLDDIIDLNAYVKFVGQFAAAAVPVIFGVTIEQVNIFGFQLNLGFLAIPVTVIWIVALTNAVNLIDGLDGLACGVSAICSCSFFAVGVILKNPAVALFGASLFGACLGFLPFNFNPAKIFMGDTGAMFLGYMLSVISVFGVYKAPSVISVAVPFIICGFPIFDTAFAFTRRILAGHSPFHADRGHSHHKLIDRGFSQKQAAVTLYAVSLALGIFAIATAISPVVLRIVLTVAVIIAFATAVVFFRIKKKKTK